MDSMIIVVDVALLAYLLYTTIPIGIFANFVSYNAKYACFLNRSARCRLGCAFEAFFFQNVAKRAGK